MKKIAILQSNYLPWKGVFDLMHQVDLFVFEDDVQYTKQDWRNRNRILTDNGAIWITVPVMNGNKVDQLIYEVEICNNENWQQKHYNKFRMYYTKAPYFKDYEWILEDIYIRKKWNKLSELNIYCNKLIAELLNIQTKFAYSTELNIKSKKNDRVIEICKKLGANYYLSGPAAKDYIVPTKFENEGIQLEYIEYKYPKYKQVYEPFNHYVTILDLLFNCGSDAPYYIWGHKENLQLEIEV